MRSAGIRSHTQLHVRDRVGRRGRHAREGVNTPGEGFGGHREKRSQGGGGSPNRGRGQGKSSLKPMRGRKKLAHGTIREKRRGEPQGPKKRMQATRKNLFFKLSNGSKIEKARSGMGTERIQRSWTGKAHAIAEKSAERNYPRPSRRTPACS